MPEGPIGVPIIPDSAAAYCKGCIADITSFQDELLIILFRNLYF